MSVRKGLSIAFVIGKHDWLFKISRKGLYIHTPIVCFDIIPYNIAWASGAVTRLANTLLRNSGVRDTKGYIDSYFEQLKNYEDNVM